VNDSSIERQKAHFDRIVGTYRAARRDANHVLLKNLMWSDFLAGKALPGRDRPRVLEAMCGFAEGKDILERHLGIDIDYTGFDYSDAVIGYLRRARPDLRVFQRDVTAFQADEPCDVVVLLGGLHHVPEHARDAVARLAAGLTPSGLFLSLEPTHGNPVFKRIREHIYKRNALFDETTERAFSVPELFGLFEAAGLDLVDAVHPGPMSYVLYYNPDAFPALNRGGQGVVRALYALDRCLARTRPGRALSFATLSLWRKPSGQGRGHGPGRPAMASRMPTDG
jgi:SAM-dependent methyltransferase